MTRPTRGRGARKRANASAARSSASSTRAHTLRVAVQDVAKDDGVPTAAAIRRWARMAAGDRASGELTVRIVDEAESAALNARYRGKRGATNVLAFPADAVADPAATEAPPADWPLGDLVVCAAVVAREAREQRKAPQAHWAHMIVHGVLHLLGYDHATARGARTMEGRERALLGTLGIDDPYVERP